ncbi:hypothetical protein [Natrinema gari]|uniref:hypothetical protein n=1 Tax=Natrinema gari TaxID=419186 RepID=UPI001268BA1D|nr:hypothetical protein [Natrinema gari]
MTNLMERVKSNPELQRKLTRKMFSLARVGESYCIPQSELTHGKDGNLFLEHPAEDCPVDITIRDVPAEFQPIADNPSVKVKVRRDIHEGRLAGDVVGVDCFAQNTETARVERRQEAKDPDRGRKSEFMKNHLNKHL